MLSTTFTLPSLRLPRIERKHWLSSVLVAIVAVNFIAAYSLTGVDSRAVAKVSKLPTIEKLAEPPAAEPLAFREVTPDDARKINAAIPIADLPNPAARAFLLKADSMGDKLRSLECLTAAVYYEAAIEGTDGQRAVAQVVLNRVRHPAFPNSVCGVVFQGSERSTGCQFTFTCDGSLRRTPSAAGWRRARDVAEAALAGYVYKPVGYATHYHTNWVVPYWSASLTKLANVGTHIFYRWAGGWGTPHAFTNRHTGAEPQLALMRSLTSDPASLADAEATEMLAASEDPADRIAAASSADSFHRAVLRRYEPVSRDGVAAVLAKQTRSGDAVAASHRWALTGARPADTQALGQPEEVKPVPKACVDGAKKAETAESLAKALICS